MDDTTTLAATGDYTGRVTFTRSADAAFMALTTLEGLAGWWSDVAGDGRVDGELRFYFGDDVPAIFHVDEAVPATRVQWTCLGYGHLPDWGGTVLTFALAPRSDGGCELSFRHTGLTPKLECFDECKAGWDHFLPSLRQYVDTGIGNPRQSEADLARREARRRGEG